MDGKDGLFDVFDEKPAGSSPKTQKHKSSKSSKKRLANGHVKSGDDSHKSDKKSHNVSHQSDSKRPRIDGQDDSDVDMPLAPMPNTDQSQASFSHTIEPVSRVADAFETEQSREIAASAGLQAQQDTSAVVLSHQVRHQVSLPMNYEYVKLSEHKAPAEPARTWPFTLDPFQQVAIASIERNESVLVSAHTSAGKTVCAEYAIAQCLKNNQRVIYTSPIKALSNQKYREFMEAFGDVGLMTGDVTINPTATCLVMTTEILRSMLYRGSEIMREVAWVVFDEVHYLRDKARGVVWEETIILLPDKVRYVFLSATIPNAMQFAEWITKTHSQPCHVVYTDFRPVPLQHYLFPAGADGIHLVVDEKGTFREENFSRAMASLAEKKGDDPADPFAKRKGKGKDKSLNKGGTKGGPSDIYKIVKMIMQKSYNPVIVFSFSKRECENYALQMAQLAFNDDSEKEMVGKVFGGAIDMLSEEDKTLPQIVHLLPLLRRGIGIHHSGLLPILKETIEILFQEGLIKVLFATETFSIGLNMPAKTVVFTSVRKFDGVSLRWVSPSEFIQMSGRAGRRGIDERGIVIMMIDERLEPASAKEIVRGEQDNLNSEFHLGYNMILNLMRVEGVSPEFMLERCFYQFQNTTSVSGLEKELQELEAAKEKIKIEDEQAIKDYWDLRRSLDNYSKDMREVINHPNYSLQFMQPGRLIRVRYMDHDFDWGVVVTHRKRYPHRTQLQNMKQSELYIIDALLRVAEDPSKQTSSSEELPPGVRPPTDGDKGRMEIVPLILSCVESISHLRVFMPPDLKDPNSRQGVLKSVNEVKRRFPDGIAVLDPIENMGITDESFKKLMRKIEVLEGRLLSNPLHKSPNLPELYNQYAEKMELNKKTKALKKQISSALAVMQLEELKCRKRVLRRLGFINDQEVVQLKARVACEISTGDELVLSELLFNRFFNEMTPQQCAASLSCFIFEEKSEEVTGLREELASPFREIQHEAKRVARISQESKFPMNEEEYLLKFKHNLMEVVYAWAHGSSFAQITKMTDVYEGSLIRCFRRLEELLRQVAQAAKVMGSEDLERKFEEALVSIRRDIVAAQSLYL